MESKKLVKCIGKVTVGKGSCNYVACSFGHYLFTVSHVFSIQDGHCYRSYFALVPPSCVNGNRFIGDSISDYAISDSYGLDILANCEIVVSVVI